MEAREGNWPDWRDAAAYQPLLLADRSLIAWEWLRRKVAYQAAADRALDALDGDPSRALLAPEAWGLHAFVSPGDAVPLARPVWHSAAYHRVLDVEASPSRRVECFDLGRFEAIATLIQGAGHRQHLLISDGFRAIRVDISGATMMSPAELHFRLSGLVPAERQLMTLRRFLSIWRSGRFSSSLHPREAKARRWVLMLRAWDGLAAGANQRAIATELLNGSAAQERWRVETPSLRLQAQRLVGGARWMASEGFRRLLL